MNASPNASGNKAIVEDLFASLAKGDGRPFVAAMADDMTWTIIGNTAWSGTWTGKTAVVDDLLAPLFAQFGDRYTNTATSIIADEDRVVVECRGQVTTRSGEPYCNTYCYVMRLDDGRVKALTEYCDTALIEAVLAPPPAGARARC